MPDIEITADQRDRLRTVQDALAAEAIGKYGHVRPCDAVEYLLDRFEAADDLGSVVDGPAATEPTAPADEDDGETDGDAADDAAADDAAADGDTRLDAMMNLLDAHDDKWGEAEAADERYAVELPDGSTSHARTKDDVRALLFQHYR